MVNNFVMEQSALLPPISFCFSLLLLLLLLLANFHVHHGKYLISESLQI